MTTDPTSEKPDAEGVVELHDSVLRSQGATREGAEALGPGFLIFFLALVFLGSGYLFWNSGGFRSDVFDPGRVAWDGSGGAGGGAPPDPMVLGKQVFTRNCAICHQPTGLGVPGQFPPLAGSEWVHAEGWVGDNHIVRIVLNGLQGAVTVKGQPFNNAMASWGQVLKDEQIAAVLTYVRNEWGNKAPPIPKEFVAKIREEAKGRSEPWTQKELQGIERELVSEAAAQPAEAGKTPAEGAPPAPAASPAASPPGA